MKLTDLELVRLANNIQELLYNASDICHDRSVKFLMARAKVRSLAQSCCWCLVLGEPLLPGYCFERALKQHLQWECRSCSCCHRLCVIMLRVNINHCKAVLAASSYFFLFFIF